MPEPPTDAEIESRIFDLLARRAAASSICPSEVARAFSNSEATWRPLMDPIRRVAAGLSAAGKLEIAQRGERVEGDLDSIKGPIRLRLPRS